MIFGVMAQMQMLLVGMALMTNKIRNDTNTNALSLDGTYKNDITRNDTWHL
jgi:hypothetical protein